MVSKTQQWLIQVTPIGDFEEITAFFVGIGIKNIQKSMKQQKCTLFDKLIPIFVQTTKVLNTRTSNDMSA